MAVDAAGDVFVADTGNNAVKEVLPDGTITTIGSGFNDPTGVAVDAAGDVFVADTGNSAVKEVLPNGTIKTIGSGFNSPTGVAVDAAGDVFVADSGNNRVGRAVAADGRRHPLAADRHVGAGGLGQPDRPDPRHHSTTTGPSPPAPAARSPARPPRFVTQPCRRRPSQPGRPPRSRRPAATLDATVNPNGVDHDGPVPVLDQPTFTPTVQTTVGSGFSNPHGVAVDGAGDVFVADTGNNAVKEVLPDGPSPPSAPGSASRTAWRWTARATSSSPTPPTTPSRRSCPTAPSSPSAPGSTTRRRGGGRRRRRLRRRHRQQRRQGGACPTAPSTPSAPGSATRPALRWTPPATSSSPTRQQRGQGGAARRDHHDHRLGVQRADGVAVDAAGDVFVADSGNSRSRRSRPTAPSPPSARGSATRTAWRWTRPATSSSPTPTITGSVELSPPTVAAHALAPDRHAATSRLGHADRPGPRHHLLLPRRRLQRRSGPPSARPPRSPRPRPSRSPRSPRPPPASRPPSTSRSTSRRSTSTPPPRPTSARPTSPSSAPAPGRSGAR